MGDPDFNPDIPLEKLLSKTYADEIRRSISLNRKSPSDNIAFGEIYESPQTTHYSVIDAEGNAVVVTYTLEYGYGSRIVAEGLGFLLNNEMGDFNAIPGVTDSAWNIGTAPNLIRPGKRMLSNMTPTIVVKEGKPFLLIGSPGGRTIQNTVLQVILNVVEFKMNIAQAINAGRFHHQWFPDLISIEQYGTTLDTQKYLEMMGHRVRSSWMQGSAMGIMVDPETGMRMGASDPRSADGAAVGY
jgi:gamma-glutamyltranspeptidase/glutathione hydrolase